MLNSLRIPRLGLIFACLLLFPLAATAVELTVYNVENTTGKVCLLYYNEQGQRVLRGWYTLVPEQRLRLSLPDAGGKVVYAYVKFADTSIRQHCYEDSDTKTALVVDEDFGVTGKNPEGSSPREVTFSRVLETEGEDDTPILWLNLSSAAG